MLKDKRVLFLIYTLLLFNFKSPRVKLKGYGVFPPMLRLNSGDVFETCQVLSKLASIYNVFWQIYDYFGILNFCTGSEVELDWWTLRTLLDRFYFRIKMADKNLFCFFVGNIDFGTWTPKNWFVLMYFRGQLWRLIHQTYLAKFTPKNRFFR